VHYAQRVVLMPLWCGMSVLCCREHRMSTLRG
jgi:hypothetical protein